MAAAAAWTCPTPVQSFAVIAGHVAVYPGRTDRATVEGEVVRAYDGGFFGGEITTLVVGPFKGNQGSWG